MTPTILWAMGVLDCENGLNAAMTGFEVVSGVMEEVSITCTVDRNNIMQSNAKTAKRSNSAVSQP